MECIKRQIASSCERSTRLLSPLGILSLIHPIIDPSDLIHILPVKWTNHPLFGMHAQTDRSLSCERPSINERSQFELWTITIGIMQMFHRSNPITMPQGCSVTSPSLKMRSRWGMRWTWRCRAWLLPRCLASASKNSIGSLRFTNRAQREKQCSRLKS